MLELLKSGGLLMIPIFACGIIASFIIIERIAFFISIKKGETGLVESVKKHIERLEYTEAIEICTASGTPLGEMLKKGVLYRHYSDENIKEAVSNEANLQIPRLEKFLAPLGTIANISTLLGLLGTVTGNIQAFGVLGDMGTMGNPAVLAGAIAEALVTTAAGLSVSIPAIVFYNYFITRVNRRITIMEASVSDVLIILRDRNANL